MEESSIEETSCLKTSPDPLTQRIGKIGKWQCCIGVLYGLTVALFAWQSFANKFLAYSVKFDYGDTETLDHFCESYNASKNAVIVFEENKFAHTIVSRWNLICERSHYPRLAQTLTFVGNLAGALIAGHVADARGRKTLIYLSLLLLGISGTLGPVAPNFYIWTGLRFLTGLSATAFNIGANVYMIEILDGKWRSICSALFGGFPFQLGILSLGLLVYLIPNMLTLEYILGGAALPLSLIWFFVPESPRWLISSGRLGEAERTVRRIAAINGRTDIVKTLEEKPSKSSEPNRSLFDILRLPGLRRNFLIMSFNWLGFTLGYYGLLYNTPPFKFNVYLVFVFPTFFAIPLNFIIPFIENKLGRKVMLTGSMCLAGIFQILSLVFRGYALVVTLLSILGTVACFSAMSSGYIYCKELFPTVLRSTVLSYATVFGRLGGILSPIIGTLDVLHPALPIGVYGMVTLLAGISSIWLWPETKSIRLPDTLEESEKSASSKNNWLCMSS